MNNQMNNNSNIDANSIGNQTEVNMNQMGVNTNSNTRNSNNGINPVRSGANVSGIDKKRPLPKKIAEDKNIDLTQPEYNPTLVKKLYKFKGEM